MISRLLLCTVLLFTACSSPTDEAETVNTDQNETTLPSEGSNPPNDLNQTTPPTGGTPSVDQNQTTPPPGGTGESADEQNQTTPPDEGIDSGFPYLTLPYTSPSNMRLNSNNVEDSYTLKDTNLSLDYYVFLHAAATNKLTSGDIHHEIQFSSFENDIPIVMDYSLAAGYSRIIQVKRETDSNLNIKINGEVSSHAYRYTFEAFAGFEGSLLQDEITFEPNDYKEIAVNMEKNVTYSSRVKSLDDFVDWYVIKDAQAGEDYYVEITASVDNPKGVSQRNLYLEYYDQYGKIGVEGIATFDLVAETGRAYTNKIVAPQDGDIYIKIHRDSFYNGSGDTALYKYTLKTYQDLEHGLVQDAITFEPNNFSSLATPIALATTLSSRLYGRRIISDVETSIDLVDWYVLKDVTQNSTYTLNFSANSDNPSGVTVKNMYFETYDEQGLLTPERTVTTGTQHIETLVPTMNGNIYIKVTANYSSYLYKYDLNITQQ